MRVNYIWPDWCPARKSIKESDKHGVFTSDYVTGKAMVRTYFDKPMAKFEVMLMSYPDIIENSYRVNQFVEYILKGNVFWFTTGRSRSIQEYTIGVGDGENRVFMIPVKSSNNDTFQVFVDGFPVNSVDFSPDAYFIGGIKTNLMQVGTSMWSNGDNVGRQFFDFCPERGLKLEVTGGVGATVGTDLFCGVTPVHATCGVKFIKKDNSGTATVSLKLRFLGSGGGVISELSTSTQENNGWLYVTGDVPSNCESLKVELLLNGDDSVVIFEYFDIVPIKNTQHLFTDDGRFRHVVLDTAPPDGAVISVIREISDESALLEPFYRRCVAESVERDSMPYGGSNVTLSIREVG